MIKRTINDAVKYFFAWIKKNRRVSPKGEIVKVNIGSGLDVTGDWINVDGNFNTLFAKWPTFFHKFLYKHTGAKNWFSLEDYISKLKKHKFIHHNLLYGIPFTDNSVDYLYSSQTLEHFYSDQAEKFIQESYRVLKPGGLIRLTIPDLDYIITLFNNGDLKKALSYFYSPSTYDLFSRHKYLYNFDLLKELLEKYGFTEVKRYDIGIGQTPDIENLDNRPEDTLYAEARKPSK